MDTFNRPADYQLRPMVCGLRERAGDCRLLQHAMDSRARDVPALGRVEGVLAMDATTLAILALLAVDTGQTLEISRHCNDTGPRMIESNPILGRCPARSDVYGYFATIAVGHVVIDKMLPTTFRGVPVRPLYRGIVGSLQIYAVSNNIYYGVGFRF